MSVFTLGARSKEAGFGLFGFDSVESTNSEAQRFLENGGVPPVWFAALEQTKGRGRHGRTWASQKGNLAATLVLDMPSDLELAGLMGFVAGVAVHQALCDHAPSLANRLTLKWPNDVLLDGAKLVGILLESLKRQDGRQALVIGIGINIVAHPDDTPYAATHLNAHASTSAQRVFEHLSDSLASMIALWNNGRGSQSILNLWRRSAHGMGGPVTVRREQGDFTGIFERLDDDGRLIVRMPDASFRVVTAGDVYF